jgi:hypothetical protein
VRATAVIIVVGAARPTETKCGATEQQEIIVITSASGQQNAGSKQKRKGGVSGAVCSSTP